ncbi:MAG TPA: 2-oxoglutarate dehydrogenase E1 component [Geobacteraceae bacterium]
MGFIDNLSPQWLEEQYQRWQTDPGQVSAEWQAFFTGFELGQTAPAPLGGEALATALKQSAIQSLIYRYRDIGHLLACTDPLSPCILSHPLLDLAAFELSEADLDTVFHTRRYAKGSATLREILTTLRETYCRSIGVEFMYLQEPAERQWLIDRMEPIRNRCPVTVEQQRKLLQRLMEATLFEEFLHRKFLGQKRFSLEGGEALIVLLDQAVDSAARLGMRELVLGMAHRGRLNVLANILRKPLENIFAEFADNLEHGVIGEGDVKYHKGFSADLATAHGRLHLSLAFNPSHLEAVDPVVEGKSRARQDRLQPDGRQRVLPLLVHGDAAFAGQGLVAETLNLSQLEGYGTGGTLHVVLNNQIGFTTLPADARSTRYATDVAKMLMIPIFHVHGEDPEAVAWVTRLALDYRQAFGRDVVIEVICYRRHGHNEGDEPFFTQPLMYEQIKSRPPAHEVYAAQLASAGVAVSVGELREAISAQLTAALDKEPQPVGNGFAGDWEGVSREYQAISVPTGVPRETLLALAEELARLPAGFAPHPKIVALVARRLAAVQQGEGLDWGNGEALAYASLVAEGVPVRLSGQDSRRGTFNHRHAVLHDLATDATHVPLAGVARGGGRFQVFDSMLSESGVLGFEYGYAVATPEGLTIWEAQFGDFANGAQVVIDQFVAAGESKWDRACGLVMLLPHGYEGQGAEHSSARIERYLQLCADHNMLVANPTTPAQFFHLLRRQVVLPFRKPLIVFTPKSLLRHPRCVSSLAELTDGGFREVIPDDTPAAGVTSVLLCCGKLYFELLEKRETSGRSDVAIIRIEQLYPLRDDLLREAVAPYGKVRDWRWVQEEPANMGAWSFLREALTSLLGGEPHYVGRSAAPAPAVGSHRQHGVEQARLVEEAFAKPTTETLRHRETSKTLNSK